MSMIFIRRHFSFYQLPKLSFTAPQSSPSLSVSISLCTRVLKYISRSKIELLRPWAPRGRGRTETQVTFRSLEVLHLARNTVYQISKPPIAEPTLRFLISLFLILCPIKASCFWRLAGSVPGIAQLLISVLQVCAPRWVQRLLEEIFKKVITVGFLQTNKQTKNKREQVGSVLIFGTVHPKFTPIWK